MIRVYIDVEIFTCHASNFATLAIRNASVRTLDGEAAKRKLGRHLATGREEPARMNAAQEENKGEEGG